MTHNAQNIRISGIPLETARRAMILVHGRGGTAEDILSLAKFFTPKNTDENDIAFLAPEATMHTWYPSSFLSPREANEPALGSALQVLSELLQKVNAVGIPSENVYLVGFSQGACLALEFAARSATRFAGIIGFSGGVIGPELRAEMYSGDFVRTPVFLGCSDRDPHIPKHRVMETAELYRTLGASVEMVLYPNMPHTIIQDEIEQAQKIIQQFSHQTSSKAS